MTKPVVFIVGADKGGVGKTTVSRALIDYLDAQGIANRAFDTEHEIAGGVLKRFYPDRVQVVDLADSDGQMAVFDTLGANVTVIDIRANLLSPTLDLLRDIGFADPARYTLIVLHVLGNSQASADEIASLAPRVAGMRYVQVGNRIGDTKFAFPQGALEIPALPAKAAEAVDAASMSFATFRANGHVNGQPTPVLRGMVGHWLDKVFLQFKAATLP